MDKLIRAAELLQICFMSLFLMPILTLAPLYANPASMPETLKINVFALVSENLENMARSAAKAISAEEGLDAFPAMGYQIHCTLYMTQYTPDKLKTVQNLVASFAEGVKPFSVRAQGISATKDYWLFINIERNRNLQTLSDAIVQMLCKYRFPSDYIPEWVKQYPQKMEYLIKYGSPNVFAEFEPHLTIVAQSDPQKVTRFLERHKNDTAFAKPRMGRVIGIGIGLADRNGQVKEPIAVYKFRK